MTSGVLKPKQQAYKPSILISHHEQDSDGKRTSNSGTPKKKQKILIARSLPPDPEGKEWSVSNESYNSCGEQHVPMSLLMTKNHGPRRGTDGSLLSYTVLGDADDFESMERQYKTSNAADNELELPRSRGASRTPSPVAKRAKSLDDQIAEARTNLSSRQVNEDQIRQKLMNNLKVFQKYREMRQENALRNWQRHSVDWASVEKNLAGKLGKDPSELLMSRLGEYRALIEERTLVEEALNLIEQRNVGFWSHGLRIGNDLLGLTVTMPKGGPREIQRMRGPDAARVVKENERYKETFEYREKKKKELKHVMDLLDPFHGHGDAGFMEIVGQSIASPSLNTLCSEFVDRISQHVRIKYDESAEDTHPTEQTVTIPDFPPLTKDDPTPNLVLGTTRLSFETKLGEVANSILTVYNKGSTAIYFEWKETKRPNPLNVRSISDNVQRFFVRHRKGVIHPGEAYDFPIIFRSMNPGIFTEVWTLFTSPSVPDANPLTVTLQGYALEEDVHVGSRERIQNELAKREAHTAANEVLELILKNVKTRQEVQIPSKRKVMNDDEDVFVERNRDLHLHYSPLTFAKFIDLSNETRNHVQSFTSKPLPPWDRSVTTLYDQIYLVPNLDIRASLLAKLNQLVDESSFPASETNTKLLFSIGYDVLVDLAHNIAGTSENIRRRLNLPMGRPCTAKFRDGIGALGDDETDQIGGEISKGKAGDDAKPTKGKKDEKAPAPAAKKDDAKGKPAASAKAAQPASVPKEKSTKKDGSEVDVDPANDNRSSAVRSGSAKSVKERWTPERVKMETFYRSEFKSTVHTLVENAVDRMISLFEDADENAGSK